MTVSSFADTLQPPLEAVREYLHSASDAHVLDGCVAAGHDSAVGPQYFNFVAWFPVTEHQIRGYEDTFQFRISAEYRAILTQMNGLAYRRCHLYGIPPSMLAAPPLLDRTRRQPLDIGSANTIWCHGFKAHSQLFHLGSFWYSQAENGALFQTSHGSIVAVLKNGTAVAEWPGYSDLFGWVFRRPETGV